MVDTVSRRPFIANVLASQGQAARGRKLRRNYPIRAYVGRNGSGKSMLAVADLLPDLRAGRPVLSTVRVLDFEHPRPCELSWVDCPDRAGHEAGHMHAHPRFEPLTEWPQLLEWKHGPILLDEITGVMDSNESSGLPPAVANVLAQLRRQDVSVSWTGLNFIRANKRIREATNLVTRCQSLLPKTTVADDGSERMWKQRQLSISRSYDASTLPIDDHSDHAYEAADHVVTSRQWIPGSDASRAYDTFDAVLRVGSVSDAGRCAHCGGVRRALPCSCSDYLDQQAAAKPARSSARSARRASAEHRTDELADSLGSVVVPAPSVSAPALPVSSPVDAVTAPVEHVHASDCACVVA